MMHPDQQIVRQVIDALNDFMKAHNLDAASWSRLAGLGVNTLGEIRKGKSPRYATLVKLARAQNVSVAEMLGEHESGNADLDIGLLKVVIDATNAYDLTSQDRAALIAAVYKIAIKSKMSILFL